MRFLAQILAVMMFAPTTARGENILIIADPSHPKRPETFLEAALAQVLRDGGNTVIHADKLGMSRGKAQRAWLQVSSLRESAREDFNQFELDGAIKKYSRALTKLDKLAFTDGSVTLHTEIMMDLAAAHLLIDRQSQKARAILEKLLVVDSKAQPDTTIFNPDMVAVFDSVEAQVSTSPTFDVFVKADPPGAAVIVNGRLVGTAPMTVKGLHKGRHYISASLRGWETATRYVEAKPGAKVAFKLHEIRGSSTVADATSAIAAIDTSTLPEAATRLATQASADKIMLLGSHANAVLLVRYDSTGSGRKRTTTTMEIKDLESATAAAHELLAESPPPTTETVTALVVDGNAPFTDDGGGLKDPPKEAPPGDDTTSSGYLLSPDPTKELVLFVAYGSATGLAAAAGIFGGLALAAHGEYNETTFMDGTPRPVHAKTTDQIEGVDIKTRGETNALIADILFGAAAAAAITAVCLHVLWEPNHTSTSVESDIATPAWGWTVGPGSLRIDF